MKALAYRSTPVLPALIDDVVEAICQQAGPRTAAKLSCVSRDFARMTASSNLWRGFYQQHLVLAPPPHGAASRSTFAHEVPAAPERHAAKACLGDLERDNVFLVIFPSDQDTTSCAIDVLATTAAAMERPFRRIDATCVHDAQDLAHLGPSDFCVFEHVDSVGPAFMKPLYAFVDTAARESGHKVVLLHADSLDTCDGGLVGRIREPLTYDVTPANFSVDPDPIHTRFSAPSTPVLPALAADVVEVICQQAGPRTAAKLSCASRDFARVTASSNLWRGFYQQHLVLAPPPHGAASRSTFAHEVPAAPERHAAKACLGDLERDNVFLVTFPREQDTTGCAIDVLATTAAAMERPFRRIDATRVHDAQDLAHLGPSDFCVFEHVDSVGPAFMKPLYAFVDAAARESGHKVVLLHADSLDTCDGGLVGRVREPLTYDVTPANFSVDPDPIHTRFSAI